MLNIMYITYISVSKSTPLAVNGPMGSWRVHHYLAYIGFKIVIVINTMHVFMRARVLQIFNPLPKKSIKISGAFPSSDRNNRDFLQTH